VLVLAVAALTGILPGTPTANASAAAGPRTPADFILAAQLPDGAIAQSTDRNRIAPYLANYAAMGLARASTQGHESRYLTAAWRWIGWYAGHMDAQGYVTDQNVGPAPGFRETSTGDEDSTDAYAGTFLLALRATFQASGDRAHLRRYAGAIAQAVAAIRSTQQPDGLTWAKPTYQAKLLMDQAESYAGLRAAQDLAATLGNVALAATASSSAAALKAGVAGLFLDGSSPPAYAVASFEDGTIAQPSAKIYYPDATSQIWLVAVGNWMSPRSPLISAARASAIASTFAARWPQWSQPGSLVRFDSGSHPVDYWPLAAGPLATGASGATAIVTYAHGHGFAWPFSVGSAGQALLTA
jgi:hypothetical protein